VALSVILWATGAWADVLWFDSFEDDQGRWSVRGSSVITVNEAMDGAKSLTFRAVTGDGDATSHPIKVTRGQKLYVHVAYMTRGGGGYLGLEELDAQRKTLSSRWIIGDGGCCTKDTWAYSVDNPDDALLGVWEVRTLSFVVPDTTHWVRFLLEDWTGGLPDDPEKRPVFFDAIELSTSATPARACTDPDADGMCSAYDNCPAFANPAQEDLDLDRRGDICDDDQDGDGAASGDDCDDRDASRLPGAVEACDAVDSDCDGDLVDDFEDSDSDGRPDCIDPPAVASAEPEETPEETPEPTPEAPPVPTPEAAPTPEPTPVVVAEPSGCSRVNLLWLAIGLAIAGLLTAWERRRARRLRKMDPDRTYF